MFSVYGFSAILVCFCVGVHDYAASRLDSLLLSDAVFSVDARKRRQHVNKTSILQPIIFVENFISLLKSYNFYMLPFSGVLLVFLILQ
jgi:hypothetical protein